MGSLEGGKFVKFKDVLNTSLSLRIYRQIGFELCHYVKNILKEWLCELCGYKKQFMLKKVAVGKVLIIKLVS